MIARQLLQGVAPEVGAQVMYDEDLDSDDFTVDPQCDPRTDSFAYVEELGNTRSAILAAQSSAEQSQAIAASGPVVSSESSVSSETVVTE